MAALACEPEDRVLVLMPTPQDAARTCELLSEAGLLGAECADVEMLCGELEAGAGLLLLTDESFRDGDAESLSVALAKQAPWSDVPLVVLTRERPGTDPATFRESANVTFVERPVRMRTLLSAVRSGLRARRRQYQVRDLLIERERAAEVLRTERERLRITLASIGDGVIITDAKGRVTFLNAIAESLTGWLQVDSAGRDLDDVFRIVNEHTRLPVENPALRALREGAIVGLANHTVLIARDGTERPIDDSAAPICDSSGAPFGTVLVFRDVTERKRAQETQARLAAIVASSDDAIVSKTLDGVIQTWNAGAERLFGYTAEEAIGKPIFLIIPPERFDEERSILERIRSGKRIAHFETVRVAKDGRRIDVSLAVSPIRDSEARVVGASKVARDITERMRIDAALRDADRRKDEFIALLAHELRNPLAPIRNGLQVMRLGADDPTVVSEARAMMERQLGHMVRLIDDLLDVSRISRNKMELRRSRVALADVVASAVETARPLVDAGGHTLAVSLPPTAIFLDGDLTRLAQVLSNLLVNSARYTKPGGHIWLTVEPGEHEAAISVRDDGIGIPAESLSSIFEMFSQIDRTMERTTGGLGIGLALVKGLVEMHGGTVTAASPGPRMGSTFTVRLPILETHAEFPTDDSSQGPSRGDGQKRHVLVVDDNRDSAKSMAMMLRYLGNEVRTAHDGIEAIEVAEAFRPQVILMDVGMPKLNGYEATRSIRERPWGKAVVIVALTGWGQDGDRERSREAGCDGHLVKPVGLTDVQKLLTELTADRQSPK